MSDIITEINSNLNSSEDETKNIAKVLEPWLFDLIAWLYLRDFGQTVSKEWIERAYKEYGKV